MSKTSISLGITICDCDFFCEFNVEMTCKGSPATWDDPAEGPEFEFTLTTLSRDMPKKLTPMPMPIPSWLEDLILEAEYDRLYNSACEAFSD